jgi:predicted aldo/keto reductase-like oxidoreductase
MSEGRPGATTVEEIEEDASVGHLGDFTLSAEEKADVDLLARDLEHVRCRICGECEPCPARALRGSLLPF